MRRIALNDWLAGLFVIGIGIVSLWEASRFSLGTARAMGPGYFPHHLGWLMIGLGVGIIVIEGMRNANDAFEKPAIRAPIFITLAIVSFALLIERLGFVPAVASAVFISTFAEPRTGLLKALALVAGVTTLSVLIFIFGLGLQVVAFGTR